MYDFFELDFLNIESKQSGDAIALRYSSHGDNRIHVIDGGFQDTGEKILEHINTYYDTSRTIDAVIVTHADGDHTGGLAKILENFHVSELWMLRPWHYAGQLLPRFPRWSNLSNLVKELKDAFRNIADLEEIANRKNIPIYEPFQGVSIGEFTVLSPTKEMYLDLVVESDKTPDGTWDRRQSFLGGRPPSFKHLRRSESSEWGKEIFSPEETSPDNEMSVVQFADLCENRILLTGDAGRRALVEAALYAIRGGLTLPGVDWFQVPHHGSRRNVSAKILDCWLGEITPPDPTQERAKRGNAIISASKEDDDHPRNAVIRACIHRGARVYSNEDTNFLAFSQNAPPRNWSAANPLFYPNEQETN
ncbi:MAG: MBL fold metallo-hydrolase [Candidatus Poribacteria bacterium]|nr:MBL fold metallo-hydrolase [Candidatus Poribacteria bacterium]MDE0506274.1 MBL fold metallo-hydrolase [Candidatus Poribacteria bacterium]